MSTKMPLFFIDVTSLTCRVNVCFFYFCVLTGTLHGGVSPLPATADGPVQFSFQKKYSVLGVWPTKQHYEGFENFSTGRHQPAGSLVLAYSPEGDIIPTEAGKEVPLPPTLV